MLSDEQSLHINEMDSVLDVLRWGVSQLNKSDVFFGHGSDNATDDMLQLLSYVFSIPWYDIHHWHSAKVTHSEKKQLISLMAQRINDYVPVPY
jgi:ribosomal protein L3 glutamine methyltransferase